MKQVAIVTMVLASAVLLLILAVSCSFLEGLGSGLQQGCQQDSGSSICQGGG